VFEVHSQTGEVVGDVLIERKRVQPPATPSPVDDSYNRRKRHEMFCRRRQSPVYSCDDGETAVVDLSADDDRSASSSSVYESCEDLLPVVVLGSELGRPSSSRLSVATPRVNGYASCCPL
jgi:hypothetical protein